MRWMLADGLRILPYSVGFLHPDRTRPVPLTPIRQLQSRRQTVANRSCRLLVKSSTRSRICCSRNVGIMQRCKCTLGLYCAFLHLLQSLQLTDSGLTMKIALPVQFNGFASVGNGVRIPARGYLWPAWVRFLQKKSLVRQDSSLDIRKNLP